MTIIKSTERPKHLKCKILTNLIVLAGLSTMSVQAACASYNNQTYSPLISRTAAPHLPQNQANRSVRPAPTGFSMMPSHNYLPLTTTDSFVRNAGGNAELIYGDEGSSGPPPFEGFSYQHRINAGIVGQSDAGLTTGHGSYLPSAWGADEFLAPPGEQSESGANEGDPRLNNADAALNIADHERVHRQRVW